MSKMIEDDFDESVLFTEDKKAAPVGNPLAGYFRMPGLTVKLPTGGRFLPKGSVELDDYGHLEIYPMRSADELLMKSPDALMSGLAVEKLIESCVPAIKFPSEVSTPDVDVLLLAIRAATYGNIMKIEVACPECEEEMEFDCDLAAVLSTVTEVPENLDLRLSKDVLLVMRPHSLSSQTRLLLKAYEEQRRLQNLAADIDEEAASIVMKETLTRLSAFQNKSISDTIVQVNVPNSVVTSREYIAEFVENTTKAWSEKIQKRVEEINNMGLDRDLPVQCSKCKHEWSTRLEFNPSTFFEQSSSA